MRRIAATALVVFAGVYAVYRTNTVAQLNNASDPLLIIPTSLSLLHDHDLDLSEYGAEIDPGFYGVVFLAGRPYNRYPIGTSLIVLPLVWVRGFWPVGGETPLARTRAIAAFCAKVLAAVSVALLFVLLVELTGRLGVSVALALVFGFATAHYPLHAGALWTHNAVIPLVLVALLLLVVRGGRHAWAAALPLALAFVTRPTCAPVVVLLGVHVARRLPQACARFAFTGATLGVCFLGWSLYVYGEPLPPYYLRHDTTSAYQMTLGRFAEGLAGHLVSPNRGLFVFTPILAFSLWGMVRAFRSRAPDAVLYRTLALIVIAHWVMISVMARKWWAGWSFGPRHLVELTPLWIVLLVPALDGYAALSRPVRASVAPLAAVALAWSLFVAVHAATSPLPAAWNAAPVNVDQHPERVWDWRDMQILR